MNVASLELCKELYELSGWLSDPMWTKWHYGELEFGKGKEKFEGEWHVVEIPVWLDKTEVPAYDLGYLLRKLPKKIDGRINHWLMLHAQRDKEWLAFYDGTTHQEYAETPEDALCKLAIELHKQGLLRANSESHSELAHPNGLDKQ